MRPRRRSGKRGGEGVGGSERRRSKRFPIELDLRYKTIDLGREILMGSGKTVNVSSSGLLFTCESGIGVGRRLEVCIHWPARLNEKCSLNLIARGRVTRQAAGRIAVDIQEYEFRVKNSEAERR
jgi:PilZ domain